MNVLSCNCHGFPAARNSGFLLHKKIDIGLGRMDGLVNITTFGVTTFRMLSHAYTDKIRHPKIGITNFGGILPHSARVRKQKTLKVLCFVISVEDYHKLTQIQFLIQPPLGSQTFRVVKTVAGHRIICSMSVCKLFYPLTISNYFCPPCKSTCTRKVVLLTLFLPHKGKLVSMAFIRRKTHISHRLNLFFG
jgi:hypothetical protein